jgi:hypothetical protein
MAAEGVASPFDIAELSIVGWLEGLMAYRTVRRRVADTVAMAEAERPDAVVLIDSWGFTIRVAEAIVDFQQAFFQKGPSGLRPLTLREVARRAGVSPAAPYHHFADKSALLLAVAHEGFVSLAERQADAADLRPALRIRLRPTPPKRRR